jgi:hypothetical protein
VKPGRTSDGDATVLWPAERSDSAFPSTDRQGQRLIGDDISEAHEFDVKPGAWAGKRFTRSRRIVERYLPPESQEAELRSLFALAQEPADSPEALVPAALRARGH